MSTDLKKKYGSWALVTGASSGIGRAYAEAFGAMGINVVLVANDLDGLLAVSDVLMGRYGVQAITHFTELSREGAVDRLLHAVEYMDIGIVVNNAGYGMMGYFIQHDIDAYLSMIRVNEECSIRLMHAFAKKAYVQGRRAALLTVTSVNADLLRGIPYSSVYSAGKSMLKNITEALYYEMKPLGVDVLNVAPGPTDTSFQSVAATNRLFFVESPQNVVERSFAALGKQAHVTTNRISQILVFLHNYLPIPRNVKTWMRGYFFSRILGKIENVRLPAQIAKPAIANS